MGDVHERTGRLDDLQAERAGAGERRSDAPCAVTMTVRVLHLGRVVRDGNPLARRAASTSGCAPGRRGW